MEKDGGSGGKDGSGGSGVGAVGGRGNGVGDSPRTPEGGQAANGGDRGMYQK